MGEICAERREAESVGGAVDIVSAPSASAREQGVYTESVAEQYIYVR